MKEGIRIGLLGAGTVGSGTAKVLELNRKEIIERVGTPIEIRKVLVRNTRKVRPGFEQAVLTDRFEDISGLYYNWDEESEIKINGKDAILYKYGKVSCCMWYDDSDGTMYCVSVIGDGSSSVNVEELSPEAFK